MNLSISPKLSNLLAYECSLYCLIILFYFCKVSSNVLPFIPCFGTLSLLCFFLVIDPCFLTNTEWFMLPQNSISPQLLWVWDWWEGSLWKRLNMSYSLTSKMISSTIFGTSAKWGFSVFSNRESATRITIRIYQQM